MCSLWTLVVLVMVVCGCWGVGVCVVRLYKKCPSACEKIEGRFFVTVKFIAMVLRAVYHLLS